MTRLIEEVESVCVCVCENVSPSPLDITVSRLISGSLEDFEKLD